MIQIRYAKSAIENEEGMNYLWIQIAPLGPAQNVRVQISLPAGLHRSRNLNGALEDSAGVISVLEPLAATELFVEFFTREREPIPCGEHSLTVELSYKDGAGTFTNVKRIIPLLVVSEEESGDILTDQEVVHRIKALKLPPDNRGPEEEYIEYTPAKLIRIDSRHLSEWEKKYRVEGQSNTI